MDNYSVNKVDAAIRLIVVVFLTFMLLTFFSCKSRKVSKSKASTKTEAIKKQAEDLSKLKVERSDVKLIKDTKTIAFEDWELEIKGESEIKPDGTVTTTSLETTVKVRKKKKQDVEVKEVVTTTDTASTQTTHQTDTQTTESTEEDSKEVDRKSSPSIKPWIGFGLGLGIVVILIILFLRFKKRIF